MNRAWEITRKRWDQLATDLCFIAFGVLSLIYPLNAQSTTPRILSVMFSGELIAAGLLLLIAVYTGWYLFRVIGYTIYAICMFTIAGLILVGSGSSVWILMAGWGMQGIVSARALNRDRVLSQELADVYRELTERRDHGA